VNVTAVVVAAGTGTGLNARTISMMLKMARMIFFTNYLSRSKLDCLRFAIYETLLVPVDSHTVVVYFGWALVVRKCSSNLG
jgi:hypothetical protein